VARVTAKLGPNPPRPPFWGGYAISPYEIEFWADGTFRLHDRFRWTRGAVGAGWKVTRLSP
jgi:pyridoxamine 5'-phosphate oxidase